MSDISPTTVAYMLDKLKPLFDAANLKKHWFYAHLYGEIWFSPSEMKKAIEMGNVSRDLFNRLEIKDPQIHLNSLIQKRKEAQTEIDKLKARIAAS